jgi:hypothetical protein
MVIQPSRPGMVPQADASMKPLCKWQITFSKNGEVCRDECSAPQPRRSNDKTKGAHITES